MGSGAAMASEWRLSAVEFDVLWRELRLGQPPYPLDIPSPGTTIRHDDEERAEIVATVPSPTSTPHTGAALTPSRCNRYLHHLLCGGTRSARACPSRVIRRCPRHK